MKSPFPPDIDLSIAELRKLRAYLDFRYSNYSEYTVMKNTIKNWPNTDTWYNSSTWHQKKVQERLNEIAKASMNNVVLSDLYPVLPEAVYRHVVSRIGAYRVAELNRQHHWCLSGSSKRGRSSHFFLIGLAGGAPIRIPRDAIYNLWDQSERTNSWESLRPSLAKNWMYGRIFERIGTRNVRIEIWFDRSPWVERARVIGIEEFWQKCL